MPPTECIYQVSNWYLKACWRKVRKTRTDGRTDGQTDGQTDGRTLPRHNTSRFSNGRIKTIWAMQQMLWAIDISWDFNLTWVSGGYSMLHSTKHLNKSKIYILRWENKIKLQLMSCDIYQYIHYQNIYIYWRKALIKMHSPWLDETIHSFLIVQHVKHRTFMFYFQYSSPG